MPKWTQPTIGDEVVRVRPTATVSDWLLSVAEVLPLPYGDGPPYTLGEAVAELGAYAQATKASEWNKPRPIKKNRDDLQAEIDAQFQTLGGRLEKLIAPLLANIRDDTDQEAVVEAAARFSEAWHSQIAITSAFGDLCDAAKVSGMTSRALRKLSAIIASQVGHAAHSSYSSLNHAANTLVSTEADMAMRADTQHPGPATEAQRLEMATDILVAAPAGRIVVWTVYYRATISRMRQVMGPITFLKANWALPNVSEDAVHDFPERAELIQIRDRLHWFDDLHAEAMEPESRLVLVRIDLGNRQVAGAGELARRRIEAALSIAVEAGGVSWQSAGATVLFLEGETHSSSSTLNFRKPQARGDGSYGVGVTAEILSSVADQLGDALTRGPMPEHLVEALASLREARMTDHRDVSFYDARPVTPRVATALEDHAMELIASVLGERADTLAAALQRQKALAQADSQVVVQLMEPFNGAWSHKHHEGRRELERMISKYAPGGVILVSFAEAVALQDNIRALPMSELQRADFEDALAICTDPKRERKLLDEMWRETRLLRARHRRVRNAVNHGLPLDAATLNSIRGYAIDTSRGALDIALSWFENGGSGAALLQREEKVWTDRMDRIGEGLSWAEEEASAANRRNHDGEVG